MATPFYAADGPASVGRPGVLNAFLVPETELSGKAAGFELELATYAGGLLVFTLNITRVIERASLDLSIWGSSDGLVWGAKPLVHFPRKYHCGESSMQWDPAEHPLVQRLRAQWQVDRWGPGDRKPLVALALQAREVPRHRDSAAAGSQR
jgi:hypothetical protein